MTGDDTLLLVVARRVASELENLGSEVLEDSSEVDWDLEVRFSSVKLRGGVDAPGAPAPTRWA